MNSTKFDRTSQLYHGVGFSQTDQQLSHAQWPHALYIVIKNEVPILIKIFISEKPLEYGKIYSFIVAYKNMYLC